MTVWTSRKQASDGITPRRQGIRPVRRIVQFGNGRNPECLVDRGDDLGRADRVAGRFASDLVAGPEDIAPLHATPREEQTVAEVPVIATTVIAVDLGGPAKLAHDAHQR